MNPNETHVRDVRGIIASIGVIVIGLVVINAAGEFSMLGAVFPRATATLMIVLAVTYIIFALRPRPVTTQSAGGSQWRRVAMFGVMLAWALLLKPVGFLTTSLVCYMAALLISNYDRWTPRMALIYCASGAGVVVGLYLLFSRVLDVSLPTGILI